MARIAGINVPVDKRAVIALTYIYGVGPTTSKKILKEAQVDENERIKNLSEADLNKIREVVSENYTVEGELGRVVNANIKRLKDINSYRGDRHKKKLPVRGQRTKTNARTKRGKRLAVGGSQPKSAAKT